MINPDGQFFSRRNWLGAASFSSGFLGASTASGQTAVGAGPTGAGSRIYNIRDFGAKGDGATLDTLAVQAAIDACNKDQGGTVLVPAGVFVIGMVELKSNVTLHLAAGGKLLGSADGRQYHHVNAIPLDVGSTMDDGNTGLLYAVNANNVSIEGIGTIDGQGAQFRSPAPASRRPPALKATSVPITCSSISARTCVFRAFF